PVDFCSEKPAKVQRRCRAYYLGMKCAHSYPGDDSHTLGEEPLMAITLRDARLLSDEVLEALRLRALHGCELGFTEADVADLLGVARETVSRWRSAYAQGGTDALPQPRSGRPKGSGRLLSDAQAQRIQALLDHHTPEEVGVAAPLWNRRAV